jgi:hypothetical protein
MHVVLIVVALSVAASEEPTHHRGDDAGGAGEVRGGFPKRRAARAGEPTGSSALWNVPREQKVEALVTR